MDYFICISISKSLVTFSYWQNGGGKPLTSFPWSEWPAPMSFYCSSSGIVIGEDAERAAANGRAGAFRNWFSLLSSGVTFDYMAKRYPINSLFLLAAEEQFRRFLREVLFDREGGLESVRGSMPLVLSFDNNVLEPYRLHVINLFKESGYGRVLDVFGNSYIASHYGKKFGDCTVLILDSDGTDLYMALYNPNLGKVIDKKVSEGYGSDPRVGQLINILWNKTEAESSWLSKEKEYDKLKLEAIKILESDKSEISDTIEFSGGINLSYFLTRVEINNIHIPANKELSRIVTEFINKNHLDQKDARVVLVLRKYAATNRYFYRNLKNYFPHLVVDNDEERDDYGNLLVADVLERFKNYKANAEVKAKSIPTEGQTVVIDREESKQETGCFVKEGEIQEEKGDSPSSTSTTPNRNWNREWRERKAVAKSKIRIGNITEAIDILQKFHSEVLKVPGTENLQKLVNSELEPLTKNIIKEPKSKHKDGDIHPNGKWVWVQSAAGGKGDWRIIGGRIHKQNVENVEQSSTLKNQSKTVSKKTDEGYKFIAEGLFLKAKEAFRTANNEEMAHLCSELNKSSRQFEILKRQLENCIKNKNNEAANKAIKEISYFITLLQKAKLDTTDAKTILNKYKSIK